MPTDDEIKLKLLDGVKIKAENGVAKEIALKEAEDTIWASGELAGYVEIIYQRSFVPTAKVSQKPKASLEVMRATVIRAATKIAEDALDEKQFKFRVGEYIKVHCEGLPQADMDLILSVIWEAQIKKDVKASKKWKWQ